MKSLVPGLTLSADLPTSHLLEANEKLTLALMRAQVDADVAAISLDAVCRRADTDLLTGLPNRALLADRMGRALLSAKRRNTHLALLFLDLNDFKQLCGRRTLSVAMVATSSSSS